MPLALPRDHTPDGPVNPAGRVLIPALAHSLTPSQAPGGAGFWFQVFHDGIECSSAARNCHGHLSDQRETCHSPQKKPLRRESASLSLKGPVFEVACCWDSIFSLSLPPPSFSPFSFAASHLLGSRRERTLGSSSRLREGEDPELPGKGGTRP